MSASLRGKRRTFCHQSSSSDVGASLSFSAEAFAVSAGECGGIRRVDAFDGVPRPALSLALCPSKALGGGRSFRQEHRHLPAVLPCGCAIARREKAARPAVAPLGCVCCCMRHRAGTLGVPPITLCSATLPSTFAASGRTCGLARFPASSPIMTRPSVPKQPNSQPRWLPGGSSRRPTKMSLIANTGSCAWPSGSTKTSCINPSPSLGSCC
jgi:hypothetical protein